MELTPWVVCMQWHRPREIASLECPSIKCRDLGDVWMLLVLCILHADGHVLPTSTALAPALRTVVKAVGNCRKDGDELQGAKSPHARSSQALASKTLFLHGPLKKNVT